MAGDEDAALRLFRETQYCLQAMQWAKSLLTSAEIMTALPTEKMSAEERAMLDDSLGKVDDLLVATQKNAPVCVGLRPEQMAEAMPATLRAALAGDPVAMNCYVATGSMFLPPGLFEHPEWLTEYKRHAPALMQKAIARGDWMMVSQAAMASSTMSSGWLGQVIGNDPAGRYRYLRLLKLGAVGGGDDMSMKITDQLLFAAGRGLSEEVKRSADQWANRTFQENFGGLPDTKRESRRQPCDLIDEDRLIKTDNSR